MNKISSDLSTLDSPCTLCELHKTCLTVKMDVEGEGDILILGESPSPFEDRCGAPFLNDSGNLIKSLISQLDIKHERFRFSTAIRCKSNGKIGARHLKACITHLKEEIESKPTSIVVPLGATALKALQLLGYYSSTSSIIQVHGYPNKEESGLIVLPMVHPSYILKNTNAAFMYENSFNSLETIAKEGLPEKRKVNYDYSDELKDLARAIKKAKQVGLVAYDIETSCLFPRDSLDEYIVREEGRILCFSLSWEPYQAFVFLLTEENYDEAINYLHDELLEDETVTKVGHNLKFEVVWSMHYGRTIKNIKDTMLEHWHLDERKGTQGLEILTLNYTDMGFYSRELEEYVKLHKEANPKKTYKDKKDGIVRAGTYANVPLEILLPYNAADTDATLRCHLKFLPLLNEKQLKLLRELQEPSIYAFAEMEFRGVRIDWDYASYLNNLLPSKIKDLESKLRDIKEVKEYEGFRLGEGKDPINFNSGDQIRELLFSYCGYEPIDETATGKPSADKATLDFLEELHDSQVVKLIKERRSTATLYNTFVKKVFLRKRGDRIHTTYGLANTETGRPNSKGPNLLNIPRGPLIKKMYVPERGDWLVQVDYSQIELRVMALQSQDANLIKYFNDGLDVHRMIAAKINKKDPENISKEERTRAKRTVFGLCYGQGALGLAKELSISETEAQDFLDKFFIEFPSVQKWMQKTEKKAIQTGQVETMFGRIRRLPDAKISNLRDPKRSEALRQAINSPIQGTASDMVESKIVELNSFIRGEGLKSRAFLTVYDSINFSVPPDEVNFFIAASKQILEDFSHLEWVTIPILCDFEIGKNWGEMVVLETYNINELVEGTPIEIILEKLKNEGADGK